jgi:hypothetical protein
VCIKAKKCIFFVRVGVFWPRRSRGLKTGEDKRHFLAEVHINFFKRPHDKQKTIGKITNNVVSTFFKYINLLIHINDFFIIIFYQLANKTRNLLFSTHLLIYIIYGDRAIIGFVANLLNRPTDGATVSVRKSVLFRPLVST